MLAMKRACSCSLLPVVAAGLISTCAYAEDKVPGNATLIAAMPPATESVLLQQYPALTAEGSVLKDEVLHFIDGLGTPESSDERDAPLNVALRYIAMAKPVVQIEGGSDFTRVTGDPGGIGVGKYKSRSIWCVERSLGPLLKRLSGKSDIKGELKPFTIGTVQAYEMEMTERSARQGQQTPAKNKRFVGFPSDHTIVMTEDKPELEHIVKAMSASSKQMPEKWRGLAAGLDLGAPVVLLRQYNPASKLDYFSPVASTRPSPDHVDIDGFGLTLPSAKRLVFHMNCRSKEPPRAVAYFANKWFRPEAFRWNPNMRSDGFEADIEATSGTDKDGQVFFLLYVLFGPNVFI